MPRKYLMSSLQHTMSQKRVQDKLSSSTDSDVTIIDLTKDDDSIPDDFESTKIIVINNGTSTTLSNASSIDFFSSTDLFDFKKSDDLNKSKKSLTVDDYYICMTPDPWTYMNPRVNMDHLFINKEENAKKPYIPANYDTNPLLFMEKKKNKKNEGTKITIKTLIEEVVDTKPNLKRKRDQKGILPEERNKITEVTTPKVIKGDLRNHLNAIHSKREKNVHVDKKVEKEQKGKITCRDLDEALNLVFEDMRIRDPEGFKLLKKTPSQKVTESDVKKCLKPILKNLLAANPEDAPIIIDSSKPKSSPNKNLLSFPPSRTDPMVINALLKNPGAILQMCWFRHCRVVNDLKGCGECYLTYCYKHAPKGHHGCANESFDVASNFKRSGAEHASRKVRSWGRKIDLKKYLPECECMGLCIDCNFFYQYIRFFSGFTTIVRKEDESMNLS